MKPRHGCERSLIMLEEYYYYKGGSIYLKLFEEVEDIFLV